MLWGLGGGPDPHRGAVFVSTSSSIYHAYLKVQMAEKGKRFLFRVGTNISSLGL